MKVCLSESLLTALRRASARLNPSKDVMAIVPASIMAADGQKQSVLLLGIYEREVRVGQPEVSLGNGLVLSISHYVINLAGGRMLHYREGAIEVCDICQTSLGQVIEINGN